MFDSNSGFAASLQAGSKITFTPPSHQIQSKTEMPHAIIQKYLQEYFRSKIGRKIRIFNLGWENNIYKKIRMYPGRKLFYSLFFLVQYAVDDATDNKEDMTKDN